MRAPNKLFPALASVVLLWAMPLFATEERIWNLGEPDRSDHEFNTAMNIRAHPSVAVQIGTGSEAGQWPHFQPASGNGAFGQHLYRYSLDFNLPASARSEERRVG